MTGGWLEHEIRSIEQVLACSIGEDDVVVLVQPSADPVAVERAVADVLRRNAVDRPVRVFGGVRPVFVEPVRVRAGRVGLVGSIGGAAILAAGTWLAGATTGLRAARPARTPLAVLAPPLARELVTVPFVLSTRANPPEGPRPPAEEPRAEEPRRPLLRPVTRPRLGRPHVPPVNRPPIEVPPVEPPPVEPPVCDAPPDRGAPRERHGLHRGAGPRPWSHSVLVPPHCDHGRPH